MTSAEQLTLEKSREYKVIKSNDIVLKTRYDFSVNEQKTLAYICSMIKPRTKEELFNNSPFILEYEFKILDYINILGLEDNGKLYNDIKATLKGLRDKSIWLTLDDGSETTVGWLSKVTTNKRSGLVRIRLDEDLIPHLFGLKEKYLSYGLKNILCMKSQYSIRIYEMLKAYYDMKIAQTDRRVINDKLNAPREILWSVDLDKLKRQLNVENIKSYVNYKEFRKYVLEIAQREINELTDIDFQFEPIRKGRKTVGVAFTIVSKLPIDKYMADMKISEKLEKKEKPKPINPDDEVTEELLEFIRTVDIDLLLDDELLR